MVLSWIYNWNKPSIDSMFKICNKLNIPVYEMFATDLNEINIKIINKSTNCKNQRLLTRKEIEAVLKEAIDTNCHISLHKLSKEKGFACITAKEWYPELCGKITQAYQKHKKDSLNQKKNVIKQNLIETLQLEKPISLQQFSVDHGINFFTVKKYYPELCKKVIERYINSHVLINQNYTVST